MSRKFSLLSLVLPLGVVVCLFQTIPYGKNLENPPPLSEPAWNSARTRALAKRACFDCHSYETVRPWYSRIAPMSWLAQYDIDKGRSELNFSDWRNGTRKGERAGKIREEINEGDMPPLPYRMAHPDARLPDAERRLLIDGLDATVTRR